MCVSACVYRVSFLNDIDLDDFFNLLFKLSIASGTIFRLCDIVTGASAYRVAAMNPQAQSS